MADTARSKHQIGDAGTYAQNNHLKKAQGQKHKDSVSTQGLEDVEDQSELNVEREEDQSESAEGSTVQGEDGDEEADAEPAGSVDAEGNVLDDDGNLIGKVEGEIPEGSMVDTEGDVLDDDGNIIGTARCIADIESGHGEVASKVDAEPDEVAGDNSTGGEGDVGEEAQTKTDSKIDETGDKAKSDLAGGDLPEGADETDSKIDETGDKAKSDLAGGDPPEGADETEKLAESDFAEGMEKTEGDEVKGAQGNLEDMQPEAQLDFSILKGMKVNKMGKIVDEQGTPIGQLVEGEAKKLAGKQVDAEGKIWDDSGRIIGRAEPLPDTEREQITSAPFEDFPDSVLDAKGNVLFEGRVIGKLVEGDPKKLEGKKVDEDGDILDKYGNTLGKAERVQEEDPVEEIPEAQDLSALDGKTVNKAGNVVDEEGKLFGRLVTGELSKLVGKKCDTEGRIWSSSGKVIGTAEVVPPEDRDESSSALFEDFPDAVVDAKGNIVFNGEVVGKLIEGDAKRLAGKKIDKDGEILDKLGNTLGKAERWTEPDEVEPEAIDNSALAGKRVNKLGYLVDSNGQIFGRVVEGDPKKLAGKMSDKNGSIMNEMGQVVGKAELVPESDRAGEKTDPFSDFDNPTVSKDGKVVDAKGLVVGRLVEGDVKKLFGKHVDPDGDVLDQNGNVLGRAERWEEEEKKISQHPALGRKVNREGNVVDENGDLIAKLTEGEVTKCAGKEVDNDGDVINGKGEAVGHVTLLADIPSEPEPEPEPELEPEETEEQIAERKERDQDRKLAGQLATCIEQSIDKINPVLKTITETIDAAERQPKEELDEQKLVDTVKPLLEEGHDILLQCNGAIRALDPDGRIQANAKQKSATREATPEEYHLAEQLKELTGNITQTIEKCKKKIAGMPHAKQELNPLWGLLAEPLGQILAAVGLLLSGVLGLVGRLLGGLGLGGLLDNLLGGLGIKGILQGLGLGSVTKSLTGKK